MLLRPVTRPVAFPVARRVIDYPRGGWSPLALFAAGEVGVWYDPSDLSTLFQDSAGTTPVTALGQPVGLMLDKSNGLAREGELIIDGGFDDPGKWSLPTNCTVSGGVLNCNAPGVYGYCNPMPPVTVVAGEAYEFSCDVTRSAGAIDLYIGSTSVGTTSSGAKRGILIVGTAGAGVRIGVGSTFVGSIDNLSVRKVPGIHARQSTDAARPKLAAGDQIDFDGIDDKLTTTFPNLGTDVTIARSVPGSGASILTGQTIGAGAIADNTDHCGLLIVNRALTAGETALLTRYLDTKAGV